MRESACIFHDIGLFILTMNDDDDRTVIQTDEDRKILERRILGELADETPEIEAPERDRQESLSGISHRIT